MKYLFVLLFILAVSISAYSQEFTSHLILGINASQVDGDQNGGFNKFGPRLGFGIDREVQKDWTLGFEILYSHKGSRTKQDSKNPNKSIIRYKYDYIEVPIIGKYHMDKVKIPVGISVAYLLSAKYDDGGGFIDMDDVKTTDLLGNLGLEYEINDKIGIEARYQYSITNIIKGQNNSSVAFRKTGAYHNLISISAIINFN